MPYLKALTLRGGGGATEKVKININSKGEFYCNVSPELVGIIEHSNGITPLDYNGKHQVFADTLARLERELTHKFLELNRPVITKTPVILFNIESHISFATDDSGNVFPNAGFPNAEWQEHEEKKDKFGGHHAASPSRGGYSLTMGAKAMNRVCTKYGDKEKITYTYYYGGGSHLSHDNPANLLNSWASFELPDNAREIPYSEEAALFFHNLMLGMAKLSKMVQDHTFESLALEQSIKSNQFLIGKI